MYPKDLKYDKEHEWVRVEGDIAVMGITQFAQDQLGEVVYVDLPAAGDEVVAGETFGEIESVKSVSELFSPVSGEIVAVNDALDDTPETVNASPYNDGWMIKVKLSDTSGLDGLMSAEDYEAFVNEA
ncbi:MAG: glycine cleavage system protein GcvH [Actinomycetota bacterium]|jgi:glycine cleavage system H protein|nr:glycine cleavage system protein GcvH [Actinomycetota bacterium]